MGKGSKDVSGRERKVGGELREGKKKEETEI